MKRGFRALSLLMINFAKERCDLWGIFNRSVELRENNIPDSKKTKKNTTHKSHAPHVYHGGAAAHGGFGCFAAWNSLHPAQIQYLFPEELAQGQRSGRALVLGALPGAFSGHSLGRGHNLGGFRVLLGRRLLRGRDISVCFYTGDRRLLRTLGMKGHGDGGEQIQHVQTSPGAGEHHLSPPSCIPALPSLLPWTEEEKDAANPEHWEIKSLRGWTCQWEFPSSCTAPIIQTLLLTLVLVVCGVSFAAWRETKHKDESVWGSTAVTQARNCLCHPLFYFYWMCVQVLALAAMETDPWKSGGCWGEYQVPSLYLHQCILCACSPQLVL